MTSTTDTTTTNLEMVYQHWKKFDLPNVKKKFLSGREESEKELTSLEERISHFREELAEKEVTENVLLLVDSFLLAVSQFARCQSSAMDELCRLLQLAQDPVPALAFSISRNGASQLHNGTVSPISSDMDCDKSKEIEVKEENSDHSDDKDFIRKQQRENAALSAELEHLQTTVARLHEANAAHVATLHEELTVRSRAFLLLEERIRTQEDYEEIRRELGMLRRDGILDTTPRSLEHYLLEQQRRMSAFNALSGAPSMVPNGSSLFSSGGLLLASSASSLQDNSRPFSAQTSPCINGNMTPTSSESSRHAPSSSPADSINGSHPPVDINGKMGSEHVLDTAEVSQRIRDILSSNNIGQRLFAKNVLSLSQGTVSELLSKPKHWDKLTEKGRESYRKMHAWASQHTNIQALKAISPKKGNTPMLPSSRSEDVATEERICKILSDAQSAMQNKQCQEKSQITNAMVASIYQQELAKLSGNEKAPSPRRDKRPMMSTDNGGKPRTPHLPQTPPSGSDMSQEMVMRIYQEELSKLVGAAQASGNMTEYSIYQQELNRLNLQQQFHQQQQQQQQLKQHEDLQRHLKGSKEPQMVAQDLTVKKECSDTPPSDVVSSEDDHSIRHSGSAFFLVRPRPNSHPAFDVPSYMMAAAAVGTAGTPESAGVSPLQKMQNIANSISSSKSQSSGSQNTKPLRAVLPPITQEQFDQYSTINTEDLVKHVKETLSQFSISQRLFGEHVLGLSQGSVSDLLARPKPWHMLTQKGREPFIRMQLFLEEPSAITKLVANQYHISPDKLLRNSPPNGTPADSKSHLNNNNNICSSNNNNSNSPESALVSPHPLSPGHAASATAPPIPNPMLNPNPFLMDLPTMAAAAAASVQPSIFEMAAMTAELDTMAVTSHVKEVLQHHNMGQKLFGEAILGLSQGSVSELLSKPKPWHMLSLKGREPFIKMHMWINDPHNIDRLRFYQSEQKAMKRRGDERGMEGSPVKKQRVFFTEEQKERLRQAYNLDPYPNQATIESLARELSVGSKTIVNWFHNHRMRAKQICSGTSTPGSSSMSEPTTPLPGTNGNGNADNGDMVYSPSIKPEPDMEPYSSESPSLSDRWLLESPRPVIADQVSKMEPASPDAHDLSLSPMQQGSNLSVNLKSSSKRKRSNPKWAAEGVQLDRSRKEELPEAEEAEGGEREEREESRAQTEPPAVNGWIE